MTPYLEQSVLLAANQSGVKAHLSMETKSPETNFPRTFPTHPKYLYPQKFLMAFLQM